MSRALLLLLLAVPLPAQKAKPRADEAARLHRLLAELEQLPPAAWQAHMDQLRSRIAAHRKKATSLRAQAAQLQRQAASEERRAKGLADEIKRLESLMALIAPKRGKPPAKSPPKKAAPAKARGQRPREKAPAKNGARQMRPPAPGKTTAAKNTKLVDFQTHVFPILEENCLVCHDQDDASGGLDLSSFASLMQGGGSGRTIVPGRPAQSRLYRLVAHDERPFMPKDSDQLAAREIETIRAWIANGAPADAKSAAVVLQRIETARKKTTAAGSLAPVLDGPPALPRSWPDVELAEVVRPAPIKTLAVSPRAPLVAVAGHRQVLLCDAPGLARIAVLPFAAGQVEVVRFSVDGRRLLVAGGVPGKRGRAALFDVASGKRLGEFGHERDTVLAAALSPGQSIVVLGGVSKKARAYSTVTGELLYEIKHRDWVLGLDISADGNYLASCDRAGGIIVSRADTGRNVHTISAHRGPVHAVRFRPDARLLASAGEDGTVRAFELEDGRQVASRRAHPGAVLSLAWSRGNWAATGGRDGRLKLWRPDGRPGGEILLSEWIYAVGFTPEGKHVVAGDWRGRLQAFEVQTRKPAASLVPSMPRVRQ